jgi:TRAP-type uncharacterized transport system substrate-binding protein
MADQPNKYRPYIIAAVIVAILLSIVAIWAAFAILRPTPPHTVAMATGPVGSTSYEFGKRYREFLTKNGIELRLVPTAGAVDSAKLLQDPKSGISISMIPSGMISTEQSKGLATLGTLFYQPVWLFYHGPKAEEKHQAMLGSRISIGMDGSAAHAIAVRMLALNGINEKTATLLSLAPDVAAQKVMSGEIDIAIFLDTWESPVVQKLLVAPNVNLATAARADAFIVLYPFLHKVVVPAGVADMANDRPPSDVVLVSPKTALVIREDLHPAIQYLLLEAADKIHSGPGVFRKESEFPAGEATTIPLSHEASQFYKTGTPFLQRNLPFWLAVLIQQLLVLIIPVATVLYPLARILPSAFNGFIQHKTLRVYSELKSIEQQLGNSDLSGQSLADLNARIDRLEERIKQVWVPLQMRPMLYNLRIHISLVRQKLANAKAIRDPQI